MKKIHIYGFVLMSSLALNGCLATAQKKASSIIDQVNPFAINDVKTFKNDFDGSTQLLVKPGPVHRSQEKEFLNLGHNAHFALGATWSSAAPDTVILVSLQLKLTRPFTTIEFNLDGKKMDMTNYRWGVTDFDQSQLKYFNENYNQRSLQFYAMKMSDFKRLVEHGAAKIRQNYSDGYYNGDLSLEETNAAIFGLRNLLKAIDEQSNK